MIDNELFEDSIKKGRIEKCYVFCGVDEKLLKDNVNIVIDKVLGNGLMDLNFTKFDGNKVDINEVYNACETMPFMSEKKIVLIYRAVFLGDKEDRENKRRFDELYKYIDNLPEHCVLIMYYVFEDEREKPGASLKKIDKKSCVIKTDKLKGDKFYKKVQELFDHRGRDIGRVELKFFCDNVDNNMDIIINEVNKLINYCEGRMIKREDILRLLPRKSDSDIFDLVDFLSQKRPEKAIEILNELIFRGENLMGILFMIERQIKLLLSIKVGIEEGKRKEDIIKELKLHPYIGEKLITQSKKFSLIQLKKCMELCLITEKNLKSSQTEKKTEMELLIVSTVRA